MKDDGALLMFDGARGYGRPVAGEAMAAAIARCRQTGVVTMTLANAHHIGRVGAYGEMATGAGLVSLHFVNVTDHRGLVAPFRGTDARFSTNPVCIALPGTDRQPPVLLDMATSAVAMGKIRVARNEGKPAPEGVLIDTSGQPTRDPNVMYGDPHGALLPFGGHKGYALAVVAELLAGAMSGGPTIQPGNERRGGTVNNMFTIIVDPARHGGPRQVPPRDRRLRRLRQGLDCPSTARRSCWSSAIGASPRRALAAPSMPRTPDLGVRGRREGRPAARLRPRGDQALISS